MKGSVEPTSSLDSFLAELLNEQQRLDTPVVRYSRIHDAAVRTPALEPVYRDLIPLSKPGPNEQYAFEVDLDSCSGCKACVAGCHALNGLDETEAWRDVGTVVGSSGDLPFQQTVTSACHHCADPGCLNGCPVLAYEKDPITGIVRHLDDQCIGCSYCILKCPYDVPKYSSRLGIVRKCDMCHGRLAEGEAPACVQACPTHAIRIVTVPVEKGHRPHADVSQFLPSAPDPSVTQPTTRYVTARTLPADLRTADGPPPQPEPAHWPLVVMLVLTQAAVGLQVGSSFHSIDAPVPVSASALRLGWCVAAAGLVASVFHLGRPLRAWRIFLGLRRSWLSREAVILGAWFGAATAWLAGLPIPGIAPVTIVLGLAGVGCSAMIYVDTHRRDWRAARTFPRFFGTAAIAASVVASPILAAGMLSLKMVLELTELPGAAARLRQLLQGPLWRWLISRHLVGAWAIGLLLSAPLYGSGAAWTGLALALVGEILERALYFRAVAPSRTTSLHAS